MIRKKFPLTRYHENSADNPCICFQVTRRIHFNGEPNYQKNTIFLPKDQNTLGYLEFKGPNYIFWDEYIAVWKIKSKKEI
jgi:hypothetical protein